MTPHKTRPAYDAVTKGFIVLAIISIQCTDAQFSQPYVLTPTAAPAAAPADPSKAPVFPLQSFLTIGQRVTNAVTDWNRAVQYTIAETNALNLAPRVFALMHLAMREALDANDEAEISADPKAVLGAAGMLSLKTLLPAEFARYNQLYLVQTAKLSLDEVARAQAIAGPAVARILSLRANDGFDTLVQYPPSNGPPGAFVNTTNSLTSTYLMYGQTTPLILPSNLTELDFIADFPAPPDLNSSDYNIQLTAVSAYGSKVNSVRSLSQTDTAFYWSDVVNSSSVVGIWNRMLASSLPTNVTLRETVDIFARFNAGLHDCLVASMQLKKVFNLWRPIDAVKYGALGSAPDDSWTPLIANPNSPTYPSFSGCFAGFASNLLQSYYGRDTVTFTVTTEAAGLEGNPLPSRTYQTFTQVATEVIQTRYLGGIEFPMDSLTGQDLGIDIADYIIANGDNLYGL